MTKKSGSARSRAEIELSCSSDNKSVPFSKGDSALKKEIEFETKLRGLLDQYGFNLKHIINLLDQQSSSRCQAPAQTIGTRKPRQLKIYKNPHTGEVVETKGGNHKRLKSGRPSTEPMR